MPKLWLGPSGRLTKGHVLDVSVKPFVRAMQDYDPQLYVRWNPAKLRGWGCWEVRRRPALKRVKEIVDFKGSSFVVIDWEEDNFTSHIKDAAFLNYDVLRKLKEIDTWAQGRPEDWAANLEKREAEHRAETQKKAREEMQYLAKQHRSQIKDFKEYVASGHNPAEIAKYWDNQYKPK